MNQLQKRASEVAARWRRWRTGLNFRSSYLYALLLLAVFVIQVGVAGLAFRDLLTAYGEVERVYAETIQGLHNIGELQYQTQETRRGTLYALTTDDADLQAKYGDQSRDVDHRVSAGIAQYISQARTRRQIEVGLRLATDWDAYLKIRDEVLSLILGGSPQKALRVNLASGVPSFDRVRQDLEEIKRLYDEDAYQQLAQVAASSRRSVRNLVIALAFAVLFGTFAISTIQRSHNRAALELARLQTDFVASVSHELRTPLTAILSAGENVKDGLAVGKDALLEQGSIIVDQATRLADLVDQVLLFARVTQGKSQYQVQSLEVSAIIRCTLSNTAALIQKSAFSVEQHISPELPNVLADLPAISECLGNLITNAIKYSDKEHWISVSAAIDPDARNRPGVQISVEDHGMGINSSELVRIFEPFYRSPQSVSARIPGTGLGLSIARTMVEALGGTLSVTSKVGVGSVFTLHLPGAPAEREVASTLSATKSEVTI